jgi:hypothetical protein
VSLEPRYFLPSLTRISDLDSRPFTVQPLPREAWELGDYVAARVIGRPHTQYRLELACGRMIDVMAGDHLIGAFGTRAATLGGVGDWTAIGEDLEMEALTCAGLFGKATSTPAMQPGFMELVYTGHVVREGRKLRMRDFVDPVPPRPLEIPVILLVGTSMSAGKTTTGRVIIHLLKQAGCRVVGAKLTGAGRYRDVLTFSDAGADHILDFVDAGLPSTVVGEEVFRTALTGLLHRIAHLEADVLVAEAGASPLEPYNGAIAIEALRERVCCSVLSASDPYAVLGVRTAFRLQPDLVTGPATNTDAAIDLVYKLTGLKALNLMDPASLGPLRAVLRQALPRGFL